MLDKSSAGSPEGVVPVTEERLEVGRRTVAAGAVRVHKRVHEVTEEVHERLVDMGFDRDEVHVQEGASTSTTGATSARPSGVDRTDDDEHGMMASIRHFFGSLFGDDDNATARSGLYSEAVRRGTSVVVVDAQDDERAERAASLLHELGAVDVDERAQQWRAEGWTGYSDEPAQPAVSTSNNLDAQRALDKGTVQAGTEGVMDVVQEELKVGKRSIDRGGVRVIQRVSEQPVSEPVRLREEDSVRRKDVDVERIEGQGSDRIERERALASDRGVDVPLEPRDPDAMPADVPGTGRKSSKDKPKRDI
jgi:stress response protein YsnF